MDDTFLAFQNTLQELNSVAGLESNGESHSVYCPDMDHADGNLARLDMGLFISEGGVVTGPASE